MSIEVEQLCMHCMTTHNIYDPRVQLSSVFACSLGQKKSSPMT